MAGGIIIMNGFHFRLAKNHSDLSRGHTTEVLPEHYLFTILPGIILHYVLTLFTHETEVSNYMKLKLVSINMLSFLRNMYFLS